MSRERLNVTLSEDALAALGITPDTHSFTVTASRGRNKVSRLFEREQSSVIDITTIDDMIKGRGKQYLYGFEPGRPVYHLVVETIVP